MKFAEFQERYGTQEAAPTPSLDGPILEPFVQDATYRVGIVHEKPLPDGTRVRWYKVSGDTSAALRAVRHYMIVWPHAEYALIEQSVYRNGKYVQSNETFIRR